MLRRLMPPITSLAPSPRGAWHYETGLVIVIGKTAKNISEADALSYVGGYCTANDCSARDLQLEAGGQWLVGKTLDLFAP